MTEPIKVLLETRVIESANPAWLTWKRQQAGLTVPEMADLIGCSTAYLGQIERGTQTCSPRIQRAYESLRHDKRSF